MKIRTALLLAGLILLTGAAFANERTPGNLRDRDLGDGGALEHASRVIELPYYLDGVLFPARHPLPDYSVSVVLGRAEDGSRTVHVFTNKDVAKEFMHQEKAQKVANGRFAPTTNSWPSSCSWTNTYSWFNTAVGCGNAGVLTLTPPNSYDDLDFGGWNNTISCVKAACVEEYTAIYSCRDFALSENFDCSEADHYYIPGGDIITDLNTVGMNNRTSSINFVIP
jgi:hypothetical protein